MKALDLYRQLDKDFVTPQMSDINWFASMADFEGYVSDDFKQRNMGVLCDFATEVNRVYTAVFPSDAVLQRILDDGARDAMLFVHHPLVWDLSKDTNRAWYPINSSLLEELKGRGISIFNYHVPLDNFSEYSTSHMLAEALGIKHEKPFAPYGGVLCGVIGKAACKYVYELKVHYSKIVRHDSSLYIYGDEALVDGRVAVVAGGGNDVEVLQHVAAEGINTLLVGITVVNAISQPAHDFAKAKGINLLGGTHYSSEKYACMAMCEYFEKLGLPCEFIPDIPCLDDL